MDWSRRKWAVRYVNGIWTLAILGLLYAAFIGLFGPLVIPGNLVLPLLVATVLTVPVISSLNARLAPTLVAILCLQVVIAYAVLRFASGPSAAWKRAVVGTLWISGSLLPFLVAGVVLFTMSRVRLYPFDSRTA